MTYSDWRPRFAEAMDGSPFYSIHYLDYLFNVGSAHLHVGDKAAIVTEFKFFPGPDGAGNVKVIHGLVAAGDLAEIVGQLIPRAEAWGLSLGCSYALIESRSGWVRQLKNSGYEIFQTALFKEL